MLSIMTIAAAAAAAIDRLLYRLDAIYLMVWCDFLGWLFSSFAAIATVCCHCKPSKFRCVPKWKTRVKK